MPRSTAYRPASHIGKATGAPGRIHSAFDVVIGADILYDRDDHAYIAKTLVAAVKPDGRVLLADPGRPTTPEFLRRLAAEGWSVRTTGHETADISRPNWTVDVMLIEARRP